MQKLLAIKDRERRLTEMDAVFLDSIMPTKIKYITTTQADYVDHTSNAVYNPPIRKVQTDPSLITGHYAENLKVSGIENKTKTWPQAMDWREDYAQFVKRNKWCNEEIYRLFFVSPPIDYQLLQKYMRDLHKSVYMYDYSRGEYVSKTSKRRAERRGSSFLTKVEDYRTTYGCYHNRLQEVEPLKTFCYPEAQLKDMTLDRFAATMRKLFTKYNATTYFDEICGPALMKAKDGIMPSGPIDHYQFRKN